MYIHVRMRRGAVQRRQNQENVWRKPGQASIVGQQFLHTRW